MRENPREKREPNNRCLNIDVKVNDPRQYLFLALWERDCFGFLCPKPTLPSFLLYIYITTQQQQQQQCTVNLAKFKLSHRFFQLILATWEPRSNEWKLLDAIGFNSMSWTEASSRISRKTLKKIFSFLDG